MRLLKPTPGECADRQTILDLKIKAGGATPEDTAEDVDGKAAQTDDVTFETNRWILKDPSPVNVQPFIDECNMIQDYLDNVWMHNPAIAEDYNRLFDELKEVNTQLWQLTDLQHTLTKSRPTLGEKLAPNSGDSDRKAAETLYEICEYNDKRAELVGKINELFSVKVTEKIFA